MTSRMQGMLAGRYRIRFGKPSERGQGNVDAFIKPADSRNACSTPIV